MNYISLPLTVFSLYLQMTNPNLLIMRKSVLFLCAFVWLFIGCQKDDNTPQPQPQPQPQPLSLKTDSTSLWLESANNSVDSFGIQANTDWTITVTPTSATWLKTNPNSGSGNAKIFVTTTAENNTASERSATIVVSPPANSSLQPISITVRQRTPPLVLVWAKQYGGSKAETSICILPTADGGFLSVGYGLSNDGDVSGGHGGEDGYVMKVDGSGNKLWTKLYGGSGEDLFNNAVPTPDGGYILAGVTTSRDGDLTGIPGKNIGSGYAKGWVMKIDGDGNKVWTKLFGGARDDWFESVVATGSGDFLLIGHTNSQDGDISGFQGGEDGWMLMIDGTGNKRWSKVFGGSALDQLFSGVNASDGGYLLAGITTSNNGDLSGNHGGNDVWVLKVDATGNKLWSKPFGGSSFESTVSQSAILATANGGCMIVGEARSNDGDVSGLNGVGDVWLLSLDGSGNKLLSTLYGGSGIDAGNSLMRTLDGGLLLAVNTQSTDGIGMGNHGEADVAFLKLDANGNKRWSKVFGGPGYDHPLQVIPTTDGGFAVTGITASNGGDLMCNHGAGDIFIMKVKTP
jgi:hypothetical protein